jgi:hypothetical protein
MAMIPGYDYDLFVSYAHADNEEQDGWVTEFVNRLKAALGMRLGASRELKVFCDSHEVRANTKLAATRKSALFLAIGSPSYAAHEWTRRELAEFTTQNSDLSRLFAIEVMPLDSGESYPSPLDDCIRAAFWKVSGPHMIQIPLSFHGDRDEFSIKVHTLADDIGKKLRTMRLMPGTQRSEPRLDRLAATAWSAKDRSVPASGRGKKTILLAQTTEDVEDEVDQLRSYLLQYDDEIEVLPKSAYPQGGDAFRAAFASDLAQADLFVQLLGKRPGRIPPDLAEGYTRFQAETARSSGIPSLQWRRPDLDVGSVADPTYRSLLQSETVIASGLEAFKLQLMKEVRKEKEKPRQLRSSTVFINADDKDMQIAKEVERDCVQNALTAILPMAGPSSEVIRRDLAENLTDCDMLIFIYGDTTQDWIRGQLRFFNKVRPKRESAPKLLAICSGPPPKPEIGISFPDAHLIDCPSGWNLDPIRKLITETGE